MTLARSAGGGARAAWELWLADAKWALPLAAYRVSRGRVGSAPQLYRGSIPWRRFAYRDLPGMTTLTERAYFVWQAQELYTGTGAIVDLGSWFGSTTATLAMGLAANRRSGASRAVIHAYDAFTWEPWMDGYADQAKFGPYAAGDSFQQEFEHVVRRWLPRIRIHAGDLAAERWSDGPIEVLLIDAMKSWELASLICGRFLTQLMPRAYVIHQDFGNCYTPWIHLVSYRLRDYLVPEHDVPRSETFVFRATTPVPERAVAEITRSSFDDAEVSAAFDHSVSITSWEKHSGIRASRVMLLLADGELERARELLRSLERAGQLNEMHRTMVRAAMERAAEPVAAGQGSRA